jgi:hypothetical protein
MASPQPNCSIAPTVNSEGQEAAGDSTTIVRRVGSALAIRNPTAVIPPNLRSHGFLV